MSIPSVSEIDTDCIAMKEEPKDRLQQARIRAGYGSASAAATAFGWTRSTYAHHENGTREILPDAAERYARAFRVSPAWILFADGNGPDQPKRPGKPIYLRGYVQAGLWQPNWDWEFDGDAWQEIQFPRPERYSGVDLFGLEVRGNSMDLLFAPGTLLICADIHGLPADPKTGDIVIVRRWNDAGDVEMTCKELRMEVDGAVWLWPRSTRPEFQTPIQVAPPRPAPRGDSLTDRAAGFDFGDQPASTLASPGQIELTARVVSHLAWD